MFADGLTPIDNTADVLDSREVIARIEWLETLQQDAANQGDAVDPGEPVYVFTEDEAVELTELREFAREGENNADDWLYGTTLIRETYFTDYIRENTPDIDHEAFAAMPEYLVIDWQATADNLATDYNEVTFGGITYYVR